MNGDDRMAASKTPPEPRTSSTEVVVQEPPSLASTSPNDLSSSIAAFNHPLASYLTNIGLPTGGVLAPIEDRRTVIESLESALAALPYPERQKAVYLSRFIVAVSVGLFDGAVNYLWNETVAAMRRLVAKVDLAYFFSVTSQINGQYSKLGSEEDLAQIAEHDLLEACRRMASVITSKPAIRDRLKTGHTRSDRDRFI